MERDGTGADDSSLGSKVQKQGNSFAASIQEGFRHTKAFFFGLVKVVTAKDENEASLAELEASKKQVKATDEAEKKKTLGR